MILTWVFVIIFAITGIGVAIAFAYINGATPGGITGVVLSLVITIAICAGLLWMLYGTEDGKRMQKTFQSNTNGGIERTVTVYGINGDIIEKYSGKFDVTYDECRVLFDDENGKRHVIYYTTGTVIIDEQ